MELKRFFKPSLMKIGTWILFAAISNYAYSVMKYIKIIPCKLLESADPKWSLCAIDPTIMDGTLYFGISFLDGVYLNLIWPIFIFVGIFIILLPYSASCGVVELYRRFISRD